MEWEADGLASWHLMKWSEQQENCLEVWTPSVLLFGPQQYKKGIIWNFSSSGYAPTKLHLHLWSGKWSAACLPCQQNQTLLHVLNNCPVARDQECYNTHHDATLQLLPIHHSNWSQGWLPVVEKWGKAPVLSWTHSMLWDELWRGSAKEMGKV